MGIDLAQTYADTLASLAGNNFQAEVCARLQSVILSFQSIPSKPHGDAGLDGYSHNGERGYCCYGMEHDSFKTSRQREAALETKFKSDLRRLFELELRSKTLTHEAVAEMSTILRVGQRLNHVELLTNWFESHRVLAPIMTALEEYRKASQLRYVDPNVTVIVVGPKQLADRYAVDEMTIIRAERRSLFDKLDRDAKLVKIAKGSDFDSKIEVLQAMHPKRESAINQMADVFRGDWRRAIAFDDYLDKTNPALHRSLEGCRSEILKRVVAVMMESDEPWRQLAEANSIACQLTSDVFREQYGEFCNVVASGEIARLIGDCPIDWER
jgi:hypothetical protein